MPLSLRLVKTAENKKFIYFSANVACSLIPILNTTGVIRTVRPVNIPGGSEEYMLSVSCMVTVYEYLHQTNTLIHDTSSKLNTQLY